MATHFEPGPKPLLPLPWSVADRPRVLVVDDEAGIRDMMTAWLSGAGFQCEAAVDADSALQSAERHPPDVALLDIALPGRDGVWLAGALRERHPHTALVIVTGLQRFEAAVEGMRLGVLDYLLKPFTRGDLLKALRTAVTWREEQVRSRAEREQPRSEMAGGKVLKTALDALLATLHTRNADACAHARRVATMATRLARALHVAEPELTEITRGALLHDIGKIAMPDALIHKNGGLSADEMALVRTHPRIGHDILAALPGLHYAARLVLHSHEAWDGSGYPEGLAGDAIPLGSRIIAIVDAFDVLRSGRVYRSPVSRAEAVAELGRCAGTQFDPEAVYAWLTLVERDEMLPAAG